MRKPLFLLTLFCAFMSLGQGQSTVQVGAGNAASPISNFAPVFRLSAGSSNTFARSNMLYRSSQLDSAGLPPNHYITRLAFFKTNTHYLLQPGRVRILMANSNRAALSTTDTWSGVQASHTQVALDSTITLSQAAGWQTFAIQPFLYTGGNLEIAFECSSTPGVAGATGPIAWQFSTPADATAMVGIQGTSFQEVMNSVSTGYRTLPNTQFTYVSAAVLSTQFLSFQLDRSGPQHRFTYRLQSSQPLRRLHLQGSVDGQSFTNLSTLIQPPAAGQMEVVEGPYRWYRLAAEAVDGKLSFSSLLAAPQAQGRPGWRLMENPAKGHLLLQLHTGQRRQEQWLITTVDGRLLRVHSTEAAPGLTQLYISLQGLAAGQYFIKRLTTGEAMAFQVRP